MLTNMEHQLQEQNALERMPEVLAEIPKVREDLGFYPCNTHRKLLGRSLC